MRPLPSRGSDGFGLRLAGGGWLALAAGLMALAAVLPGGMGLAALALAVIALLGAGVSALRAQWRTLQAEAALIAPAADDHSVAEADAGLADRLRRLREEHVAQVDAALDEGRPETARELADGYMDAALRLLTEDVAARPRP